MAVETLIVSPLIVGVAPLPRLLRNSPLRAGVAARSFRRHPSPEGAEREARSDSSVEQVRRTGDGKKDRMVYGKSGFQVVKSYRVTYCHSSFRSCPKFTSKPSLRFVAFR